MMEQWRVGRVYELSDHQRDQLNGLDGDRRYEWYRRKGHSVEKAFEFTLAWQKNMEEQKKRRAQHDTGFEDRWATWRE